MQDTNDGYQKRPQGSANRVMMESVKTDKSQFDAVLTRMLQTSPQKTANIKAEKEKAQAPKPKPSRKSER